MTLAKMGERGKPLLDFFTCMSEAMMLITTVVIYMAPVGVFFLIGGQILSMEDMSLVSKMQSTLSFTHGLFVTITISYLIV